MSIIILLGPWTPGRNCYRIIGKLSCSNELPNAFLVRSRLAGIPPRKDSLGWATLVSFHPQRALPGQAQSVAQIPPSNKASSRQKMGSIVRAKAYYRCCLAKPDKNIGPRKCRGPPTQKTEASMNDRSAPGKKLANPTLCKGFSQRGFRGSQMSVMKG